MLGVIDPKADIKDTLKNIFTNNKHGEGMAMSFPSAFDTGGNRLRLQNVTGTHRDKFETAKENGASRINKFKSNIENITTRNIGGRSNDTTLYNILYSDEQTDGTIYDYRPSYDSTHKDSKYENPFHFPTTTLRAMNSYRMMYNKQIKAPLLSQKDENGETKTTYATFNTTMSMFNPNYNVQSIGISPNVPLLIDTERDSYYEQFKAVNKDISDCSIHNLVKLSTSGELGTAIYKYADFMYCKDLGKVSNNHLITLRKYAFEVGDHVSFCTKRGLKKESFTDMGWDPGPEEGHLVTWFGTEDNKLDDILKYSYQYTWKELKSERQDLTSQEDSTDRGIIGMLANFNPSYHKSLYAGTSGSQNVLSKVLGGTIGIFDGKNHPANGYIERLGQYDKNKVYTKKQTIQDMYIPEGQLKFQHEFNLTFSYRLRAYENINPKSAFLDLLNNILRVTYFDGPFWGGESRIIGPKPNQSAWRKADALIDGAFKYAGGAIQALADGSLDFSSMLGMISSFASVLTGKLTATIDQIKQGGVKEILNMLSSLNNATGLTTAIKGELKNALGRPSFYAFNSLLTGDDTGLWHVTIGNPLNPIVSFGNLIMTNATVQHSGPLGIDDFPTELKVIVTLKHARSRDASAIGKMYTLGMSPLSFHLQNDPASSFSDPAALYKSDEDIIKNVQNSSEYRKRYEETNTKAIEQYEKEMSAYNTAREEFIQKDNENTSLSEEDKAKRLADFEKQQKPTDPKDTVSANVNREFIVQAQDRAIDEFMGSYTNNDTSRAGYITDSYTWMMANTGTTNIYAIMRSRDETASNGSA